MLTFLSPGTAASPLGAAVPLFLRKNKSSFCLHTIHPHLYRTLSQTVATHLPSRHHLSSLPSCKSLYYTIHKSIIHTKSTLTMRNSSSFSDSSPPGMLPLLLSHPLPTPTRTPTPPSVGGDAPSTHAPSVIAAILRGSKLFSLIPLYLKCSKIRITHSTDPLP